MKHPFFFLLLCICGNSSFHAQRFQVGLAASTNVTFLHKSISEYESAHSDVGYKIRFGVAVPVYFKLSEHWWLKSGAGLHIKEYQFRQKNFGVSRFTGYTHLATRFLSYELPLVLSHLPTPSDKWRLEYSGGFVLAINAPVQNTYGYRLRGGGTFDIQISTPEPQWEKTFSPDLYLSLGFSKRLFKAWRQQFLLSYQYGLGPTARFDFTTTVIDSKSTREYKAILRPTISCLTLGYAVFPALSKKKKEKDAQS